MKENRFRENLRKVREDKNISQKELAAAIGIPVSTYRNYENTARQPDYDTLVKISSYLNVSIDYLIGNITLKGRYAEIATKLSSLSEDSLKDVEKYIDYLCYLNLR